jgi:hypothetical protein
MGSNSKAWDVILVILIIDVMIKFMFWATTVDILIMARPYAEFLVGNCHAWPDIVSISLVLYLGERLQKEGFGIKRPNNLEDPGTGLARMVINNKFGRMVEDICYLSRAKMELSVKQVLNKKKPEWSDAEYNTAKSLLVKDVIENHLIIEDFKQKCLLDVKILALRLQSDVYKVNDEVLGSFFWRNFSYYLRKEGRNFQAGCLVCII